MLATQFGTLFATATAALLGLGCVRTETNAVLFDPPGAGVAVFASRAPAGGEDLGVVSARGGIGVKDNNVRDLYIELVRQTKALGGNALRIDAMTTRLEGEPDFYSSDDLNPACDAGCTDGPDPTAIKETMTVELRGKAFRLPPGEIEGSSRPKAP